MARELAAIASDFRSRVEQLEGLLEEAHGAGLGVEAKRAALDGLRTAEAFVLSGATLARVGQDVGAQPSDSAGESPGSSSLYPY